MEMTPAELLSTVILILTGAFTVAVSSLQVWEEGYLIH